MQSRVLAILIAVVLALVATAALVVYVNGADRRAISDQRPVMVFVAKETIKAGTSGLDARNTGLIDQIPVPKKNVVDGYVRSVTQLRDRFAAVDIVKGEQLLLKRWVGAEDVEGRRLLQIPTGHQAVAIELDLTRQVAGFITPGDSVSLILSMKRRAQGGREPIDRSQFLLQNVQVLAVGATALTNVNTQGGGGRITQGRGSQNLTAVTLAVEDGEVEQVVYAAEYGSIYLSLLPPNAKDVPNPRGRTADDVIPQEQ
jgi:pilus assembly protein CpaB